MIYIDATELQVGSALGYAVAHGRSYIVDFCTVWKDEPEPWPLGPGWRWAPTAIMWPIVHRLDCPEGERS
jgi:hypothetical protein